MINKLLICLIMLSLVGCTSKNEHGECIGAFEDGKPEVQYKVSTWNVVLAALFIETIFVPVIVVLNQTKCPVGEK